MCLLECLVSEFAFPDVEHEGHSVEMCPLSSGQRRPGRSGGGELRRAEVFLRPIGRRRTRSAADPGVAGRCAGPHERLGSHAGNRRHDSRLCREDLRPASPPHTPGQDRRGTSRQAEVGCGGLAGDSSASAVPSQRRSFVSRKPPKRRLRPRAALRETSDVERRGKRGLARRSKVWCMHNKSVATRVLDMLSRCTLFGKFSLAAGEFQNAVPLKHVRQPGDVRPLPSYRLFNLLTIVADRASQAGRHCATNLPLLVPRLFRPLLFDLLLKIAFLLALDASCFRSCSALTSGR